MKLSLLQKHIFPVFLLSFISIASYAAKVDTLLIHSQAMNTQVKTIVINPDKALNGEKCPVIYLLHGYSGNEKSWLEIKPNLPQLADQYGIIFICPNGKNSWYYDSPVNKDSNYETFVSSELINFTDSHFNTIANREHRAITGLSMGGHGAMWISIRHKNIFGACGSTSGGLDIRPFPEKWEIKDVLGDYPSHKATWDRHTVINQLDKIENKDLAIIIDCGMDDFFLQVNQSVHMLLRLKKIDHDFIVRPGKHNHEYWNNSIDYQIVFFDKFFKRQHLN